MNKAIVTALILLTLLSACKTLKLTSEEKKLISDGDSQTPFRVLVVTNVADSLMLRKRSTDVNFSADKPLLDVLINRLKTTMLAESGVGIAAPQIGLLRNVFLFTRLDKPGKPVEVAINPRIISFSPETFCFERDGCLSVPDRRENTKRYKWIEVEYLNSEGQPVREKLTGALRSGDFTGIIFQHEFDHLQGVLYVDKVYK